MANVELRTWKKKAHFIFDKQWKGKKRKFRKMAYDKLDGHFGFEVHIGESDISQCKNIIEFCNAPPLNNSKQAVDKAQGKEEG